jgi:hypothetical protein
MGDAQGADEAEITNALNRQVLNRTGDYREMQGAYVYLASDASSFCTGHDLYVLSIPQLKSVPVLKQVIGLWTVATLVRVQRSLGQLGLGGGSGCRREGIHACHRYFVC